MPEDVSVADVSARVEALEFAFFALLEHSTARQLEKVRGILEFVASSASKKAEPDPIYYAARALSERLNGLSIQQ